MDAYFELHRTRMYDDMMSCPFQLNITWLENKISSVYSFTTVGMWETSSILTSIREYFMFVW